MQNVPFLARFAIHGSSRDRRNMIDVQTADEELPLALEKHEGYFLCPKTLFTDVQRETTDDS
ncbi:MAG: hypothetical protein JSR92_16280 [Proteobacteria bacterium]|nr:hypothetical protein [Pseudomonadota bacterium]